MANNWDQMTFEPLTKFYYYCNVGGQRSERHFWNISKIDLFNVPVHQKLFTMSDASVGLDDLFLNTELTKFRERNVSSHLLEIRVFPLGSFFIFFSTCARPPCLLEEDGVLVPGSYRAPLVIEFSNAGTKYGELGGSVMHELANFSFSHEDPHDLAILVLDPGEDSNHKDDPFVMTFPEVDFTNLTFIGLASYAYVNWTVDNSECHLIILINIPQFCRLALLTVLTTTRKLFFPTSPQFAPKKLSMVPSATGFSSQRLI